MLLYLQKNEVTYKVDMPLYKLLEKEYLTTSEAAKVCGYQPERLVHWRTRHVLSGPPFMFLPHCMRPDGAQQIWYSSRELKRWLFHTGLTGKQAADKISKALGIAVSAKELKLSLFSVSIRNSVRFPEKHVERFIGEQRNAQRIVERTSNG